MNLPPETGNWISDYQTGHDLANLIVPDGNVSWDDLQEIFEQMVKAGRWNGVVAGFMSQCDVMPTP